MCDCEVYVPGTGRLFFLELKSHKGKSLPLSAIRENQVTELAKAATYQGIIAGFIVNFQDMGRSFFAAATGIQYFRITEDRRSIPLSWFEQYATEIPGQKKKVHYRWDIQRILNGGVQ
jgi:recombination protein U